MKWWGWGAEDKKADLAHSTNFLPYVRQILGCRTDKIHPPVDFDSISLNPIIQNEGMMQALESIFLPHQKKEDKLSRVLHAYGKSFRDLARIRRGEIARAPDMVVYPENEKEIQALMIAAISHDVCILPFGGGSNIVGALEGSMDEPRMWISVDLCRMDKVLSIDSVSQTARIQAGAYGPSLEEQLNAQGYSLGHFPDSFEYSTLGGWLATRSVGMQSDRYGTISDMLLGLTCVTPQGVLHTHPSPHASIGPSLNQFILGSEGRYGIITEAVMKVHPKPVAQEYGVLLFPDFMSGVHAIKKAVFARKLPIMMRLVDAQETQLSMQLKPPKHGLAHQIEKIMKKTLGFVKKIDFNKSCLCILAFHGTKKQIKKEKRELLALCRKEGAVYLGQEGGKQWFARKYEYPYLRDVMLDFNCVADVAETAVLWKDVEPLYHAVKKAGYTAIKSCLPEDLAKSLKLPGYIGCHLSHHYQNGTCMYFTFGFLSNAKDMLKHYNLVKQTITSTIMEENGSLSHHHSVGYEHAPWLNQAIGETGVVLLKTLKKQIDKKRNLT